MTSPYGLHILVDSLTTEELEKILVDYIIPAQPKWINVTGGARFTQAKAFVQQVRTRAPAVNIILRLSGFSSAGVAFSDNGVWKTMTPQNWIDLWVKPNAAWLKQWNVVFMVDNESVESGAALEAYANWMAEVIRLAAALGIRLAVGRFPAGNPQHGEYIRLLPMFKALAQFGGIWSPNEYFGQTADLSNDLVGRFIEGLNVCDNNNLPRPEVVIGEYGVAYATLVIVNGQKQIHLDPNKGFSHSLVGWSEEQLFRNCQFNFVNWIGPRGGTVCVFASGKQSPFETFGVGSAFYSAALLHADDIHYVHSEPSTPPPEDHPTIPLPPIVVPAGGIPLNDLRWLTASIRPLTSIPTNVRHQPSASGNVPIASLSKQVQGFIAVDPSWGDWALIRFDNVYGWVSKQFIVWIPLDQVVTLTIPVALYQKLIATLRTASEQTNALADILQQVGPR